MSADSPERVIVGNAIDRLGRVDARERRGLAGVSSVSVRPGPI
jgi:hypothetical protein